LREQARRGAPYEQHARWLTDYQRVEAKRDATAKKFGVLRLSVTMTMLRLTDYAAQFPPRLIFAEQLGGRAPPRLILIIDHKLIA
jgi:hypothetical protein